MNKTRILITSVGSLVGWTVLAALRPLRSRLTVIGCNSVATSPTVFDCDRAYLAPETADATAYRERLREIVCLEKPDLIIPGRDQELAILSALAAEPAWRGIRVLAPPASLVPVFNDKLETARFAAREGLPFAWTACTDADVGALMETRGFPLIVKPRSGGHASKGVRIVSNAEQLRVARAMGDMLVQEVLAPETMSGLSGFSPDAGAPLQFAVRDLRHAAEWLVGDDGELLSLRGVVSHTEGPLSIHMRLSDDAALVEVAGNYARALARAGHRGVANIQGKRLADGRFVPFELNGRFTGSAAARAFMGCNQIAQAVCHFLWHEQFVGGRVHPDTTALRSAIYRPTDQAAMDTLVREGVWSGDHDPSGCAHEY